MSLEIDRQEKPSIKLENDYCSKSRNAFMFYFVSFFSRSPSQQPLNTNSMQFTHLFLISDIFFTSLSRYGNEQTATERLRQFQINGGPQHSFEETIHRVSLEIFSLCFVDILKNSRINIFRGG